jgi:hypothetical protein
MALRRTTNRPVQSAFKSKARFVSSTIICLFVVAAVGEGFACAYLWDRASKAEAELAERPGPIMPADDADNDTDKNSDSDADGTADDMTNAKQREVGLEALKQLLEEAQTAERLSKHEIAEMRTQQRGSDSDNARLNRRLGYLTERVDAIVYQRERLAVANEDLLRQLDGGSPAESVRASRVFLVDYEDDGWRAVPVK